MSLDSFRPDFGDASGSCSTFSMDHENATANKRLKENVMPLELAIRRELDYRARVENVQGVRADKKEAYLSFQGPTPAPNLSGKKRKSLASTTRFFQGQNSRSSTVQNESGKLMCTLCQLNFSSKSALRQHRQDSIHKANLMESQKKGRQSKNRPQWCKLCRISCSDERAFTQHLAGKKHAASVHAIEAAKSIKDNSEKKVLTVNWDELEWDNVA